MECRVQKRDGTYLWVEANLRPVRDPITGVPTGLVNIIRDISQRKAAEQEREFNTSLLHAIHDVSLDGILVVSGEGKIVSVNHRFFDVWRLPPPTGSVDLKVLASAFNYDVFLPEVSGKSRRGTLF